MQNLVTIPQGVSFPRMREIAHQSLLGFFLGWFFLRPTTEAPETIFTQNSQTTRKDVPFPHRVVSKHPCLFHLWMRGW